MNAQTLELAGKQFVVIERTDYERLVAAAGVDEADLPPLPPADAHGNRPALDFARVSLARKIIAARRSLGWSQAELAKRARIRVETINRIERARNSPDVATVDKIDRALSEGEHQQRREASRGRR